MAWELSSWMVLVRLFQLVGALAAGCMNGFLIAWISIKKLGLTSNMQVLEIMICLFLIYTTLALVVQHTSGRSKRTPWLVAFVVWDVLFVGVDLGMITVLARAGVPSSCAGFTRPDFTGDDAPNNPGDGYTTVRFSDERAGSKGELDKFCAFERSFYFVAIGIIFTFIITIILTILRICEGNYTKNARVNQLLDSLERANEKEHSPLTPEPRQMPLPPPSEGIITRQTSTRSVTIATPVSPNPYRTPSIPRRPVPRRSSTSPLSSVGFRARGDSTDNEDEDSAAAALVVADGLQHHNHRRQQEQRQQRMPMLAEDDLSIDHAALVADGMQHHRGHHQEQQLRMPILIEEEPSENAALVSDGMRPMPMLPPYSPGSARMVGHADEGNDMRLSGYVKGETRAQNMKDSGRY